MEQSNFLSINWRNFLQGLLMAVLTPVFVIIQQSLESGDLVFNWKSIGVAAIAGGLAYISKKFFQGGDTAEKRLIGKRPKDRD